MALVAVNIAAHWLTIRWDVTDDHRYSLSNATAMMLKGLDEELYIGCLLDGELNAGFKRLKHAVADIEDEMDVYADVRELNLSEADKQSLGLKPTLIHERTKNGQTAQTEVYPYVVMQYKGRKTILPLLSNNRNLSGEENLNNSIAGLEYRFAEAIHSLSVDSVPAIAFLEGHGELCEPYVADITMQLSRYFRVDRGAMGTEVGILDPYKVVIIADPQLPFLETDKYILDQYIMQGGRVLWLVNGVQFSTDVLSKEGFTPAIALELNISDMLFRYGVRVDPALVQDVQCLPIPVDVSGTAGQPNYQPMPWYYSPLLLTSQVSPITRNCMQVSATFASPIEAVGGEDGIEKEILLATSTASRLIGTPAQVDLTDINPDLESFRYQFIPVAISMKGVFPSFYAHRLPPEGITGTAQPVKTSQPTKQIVMGAGSIIRNEIQQGQTLPVGYDRYSQIQFGNRDVLVNSVLWLADDEGLMTLRGKEVTLRLLNDKVAHENRSAIQWSTILIPLALLIMIGLIINLRRKQKYMKRLCILVILAGLTNSVWSQNGTGLLNYPLDTLNGKIFYRYPVEKSIGLYRISVNFGVSQDEILKYNPEAAKTGLRYGETVLLIPVKEDVIRTIKATETVQALQEKQTEVVVAQEDSIVGPVADTVIVTPDTIVSIPDTNKTHRCIGLLLPLQAKSPERDASMDRFFEFYAGALLALQDVQSPERVYTVKVYDTEKTVSTVKALIEEGGLHSLDAIIGPAYPAQVLPVGDYAKEDSIPVIVPFIDNVVGIKTNPMLWQFNPSEQTRAEKIADYLQNQGDSLINIVLPEANDKDIPRSILAIRKAIKARHLPVSSITVMDILNDSLSKALDPSKMNYLLFNTERYSNLSMLMPQVTKAAKGYYVTLISQYSWQNETIKLPQIYTSVFAVANDSTYSQTALDSYNERYEALLGKEHVSDYPRYDLLGYDIIRNLDAYWRKEEYKGLQSDIRYEQIDSLGGWENKAITIVEKR